MKTLLTKRNKLEFWGARGVVKNATFHSILIVDPVFITSPISGDTLVFGLCRACDVYRWFRASALVRGKIKSCGCLQYPTGSKSHAWKGGRYINTSNGYAYRFSPNHPRATSSGYVPEHHIVMENHIGRYLLPDEEVHHRGAKDDNRIELLELWSISHPAGHRVNEKITWAKHILSQYYATDHNLMSVLSTLNCVDNTEPSYSIGA